MCRAFPVSEYYGGSAPSRLDQPTTDSTPKRCAGGTTNKVEPGRFPCSPDADRPVRRPAIPRRPSGVRRRPSSRSTWADGFRSKRTPVPQQHRRVPHPDPDPPGWSRFLLTRRQTLVSLVRPLVLLAEPAPSGSADTSRHCRGCFPPSPAPPGSGCPQLHQTAATAQRCRSHTLHSANQAPHGARCAADESHTPAQWPAASRW